MTDPLVVRVTFISFAGFTAGETSSVFPFSAPMGNIKAVLSGMEVH